jgi:hypothetical protein
MSHKLEVGDLVGLKLHKHQVRTGWHLGVVIAIYPNALDPSLEVLWFNGLTYELNERRFKKVSL